MSDPGGPWTSVRESVGRAIPGVSGVPVGCDGGFSGVRVLLLRGSFASRWRAGLRALGSAVVAWGLGRRQEDARSRFWGYPPRVERQVRCRCGWTSVQPRKCRVGRLRFGCASVGGSDGGDTVKVPRGIIGRCVVAGLVAPAKGFVPEPVCELSLSTLCSRAMATSHERVGRSNVDPICGSGPEGSSGFGPGWLPPSWGSLQPGRLDQVARWSGSCDEARLALAVRLAVTSAGSYGALNRDMGLARSLAEEFCVCASCALAFVSLGLRCEGGGFGHCSNASPPWGHSRGRRSERVSASSMVTWMAAAGVLEPTHAVPVATSDPRARGRHVGGHGIRLVIHPKGARVCCVRPRFQGGRPLSRDLGPEVEVFRGGSSLAARGLRQRCGFFQLSPRVAVDGGLARRAGRIFAGTPAPPGRRLGTSVLGSMS